MVLLPRTTLHGVDQIVPDAANLPDKGNMASECFTDDLLTKYVYDAASGVWLPIDYMAARWDFDSDGGAIADIGLGVVVPAGTILLDGLIDVLDPLTSEGAAKIAVKVEGAGDVLAAGLISSVGTLGLHDIVADGTATNMIKATVARTITLTPSVAALTAGALIVYLRCVRGFLT